MIKNVKQSSSKKTDTMTYNQKEVLKKQFENDYLKMLGEKFKEKRNLKCKSLNGNVIFESSNGSPSRLA